MNVIVINEKKELNNLTIDVLKKVEGIYSVNELIGMFTNFFFNKMILDVTAIREYSDYRNLKKLFEVVDANKVILYLSDNSICTSKEFMSDLVTLGVYNFTTKYEEIMELYNNPRTYQDVNTYQISKSTYEINAQIDDANKVEEKEFTFEDYTLPGEYDGNKKIIGVVNLTEHAGATTLVVQMVKQLRIFYNVIGIEMNKQDFVFFDVPNIYSCTSREDVLRKIKEHSDTDAVIVDLNNFDPKIFCTDVIYLMEPGNIKMTKLIRKNGKIFEELSGEKLVLNRSNLSDNDIAEFEVEGNLKIFANVSNFRDNLERVISVDKLLDKLGYKKCGDKIEVNLINKKRKLFGKF